MIRLGVVDFDTSHSIEFTKRLNHRLCPEDQWVDGAEVVVGCVFPSAITPQEIIDRYVDTFTKEFGLPLVDHPEKMLGRIDGVFIEAVDGSVHLERALPFLNAGVPLFIDKPFTCSVAEARDLIRTTERNNVPIFSSSSLRYAPEVVEFLARREETGAVIGCEAFSPASLHPRNPGLCHYGIHGVETLYALMGAGCETVGCTETEGTTMVTGRWKDGRIGTLRGIRQGAGGYGATLFCEKGIYHLPMGTNFIYRELLKQVVSFFQTGQPPVAPAVTLEIIAFIEAALASARAGGQAQVLEV
ncbi:MAG: Gfo/Idh/MocA family oxidoreductase [Armatimonadetes bacterium]|nr:Gfo/Idh/MocA family oxidoreductase [Armatimonadota bacterium]